MVTHFLFQLTLSCHFVPATGHATEANLTRCLPSWAVVIGQRWVGPWKAE